MTPPIAPRSLEELRVAQAELSSGNTSGQVYHRLSPGAALLLSDRSLVQAKLAEQILKAVAADPVAEAANLRKPANKVS